MWTLFLPTFFLCSKDLTLCFPAMRHNSHWQEAFRWVKYLFLLFLLCLQCSSPFDIGIVFFFIGDGLHEDYL